MLCQPHGSALDTDSKESKRALGFTTASKQECAKFLTVFFSWLDAQKTKKPRCFLSACEAKRSRSNSVKRTGTGLATALCHVGFVELECGQDLRRFLCWDVKMFECELQFLGDLVKLVTGDFQGAVWKSQVGCHVCVRAVEIRWQSGCEFQRSARYVTEPQGPHEFQPRETRRSLIRRPILQLRIFRFTTHDFILQQTITEPVDDGSNVVNTSQSCVQVRMFLVHFFFIIFLGDDDIRGFVQGTRPLKKFISKDGC